MRKLLMSGAVLALMMTPALAQRDHPDRGHGGQGRPQTESRQPQPPAPQMPAPQAAQHAPQAAQRAPQQLAPQRQAQEQQAGGRFGHDRGENRSSATPTTIQSVPTDRSHPNNAGNWQNRGDRNDRGYWQDRGGNGRNIGDRNLDNRRDVNRDFNRDGRTDYRTDYRRGVNFGGPRHDFSGFRDYHRNFHASRHFHASFYRRPAGWYSHRWTFGEFLPAAFWARDYWLIDFEAYDLPPPPYGAVWVRVGDDALLIDEASGEIITVEYAVFY